MVTDTAAIAPKRPVPFAPWHKRDHDFFLIWLVLIWIGIAMGFGSDFLHHLQSHERPYPLIVHFHAAVFLSFLVLLTAQILLVRRGRTDLHRKLGIAGVVLAAVMLVLGPATAIAVQRVDFGTPLSDPPFMAIQFGGILVFAILVAAAFVQRKNAPAHKRLMLLAVLAIADAGFARWLGGDIRAMLGNGFWPFFAQLYLGSDILILGMGAYDLATRGRLHPAYVLGTALIVFAYQLPADILYHSAAWKALTVAILGH